MDITARLASLPPEKRDLLLRKLDVHTRGNAVAGVPKSGGAVPFEPAVHGNFRVQIGTPGILESLQYHAVPRVVPGPGHVEIEVHASALNFRDVLLALGMYPQMPGVANSLGSDCAGRVTAIGEGVTNVAVGDEVIATVSHGFSGFVHAPAHAVARKPRSCSFEEASAIPTVYWTAYYALHHLGHLSAGERVLIHAATGGVGLAAVQIARARKAEIFATAGTDAKRDYLRALGIEHVMDSRSLAFGDEVLAATSNEGVDVVLNSLPGEAIARGLSVLRVMGRFLEIGKRDIYGNSSIGLLPFRKSLSFHAIDMSWVPARDPGLFQRLLEEIVAHYDDGSFAPLPVQTFPAAAVGGAFASLAEAKHIGKVVVSMKQGPVSVHV